MQNIMLRSMKKGDFVMEALIVIDVQKGLLDKKEFTEEKKNIMELISYFKNNNKPIIFTRQIDMDKESIFYKNAPSSEILGDFKKHADYVITKETPDSFLKTELGNILKDLKVDHVFICGFNTEYCCLFTAISAFSKGYKVTFMENATGSVCDENTYEMPGLDIRDFVGSVLNWSNVIEVIDCDELIGS